MLPRSHLSLTIHLLPSSSLPPFKSHDPLIAFFGLGWGGARVWSSYGHVPKRVLLCLVSPLSTLLLRKKRKRKVVYVLLLWYRQCFPSSGSNPKILSLFLYSLNQKGSFTCSTRLHIKLKWFFLF